MNRNMFEHDTIAALATPNGRGGIAIIKISGPDSLSVAKSIFHTYSSPSEKIRHMMYGHIMDGAERVDEAMLCYMQSPRTYTGEDVVEIQTHGGHAVATTVLSLLMKRGVRPAEPGEFTRRAFLNGRIDLVQAESVMEIVSAETNEQLRQAERLLDGKFSHHMDELLANISRIRSFLEVNLDFSDQDMNITDPENIRETLDSCIHSVDSLISTRETAHRLRNGFTVALTGKANSGKSSLFNALLGKKRAIVSHHPGTTRDWIEERLDIKGIPVNLIDTAGIRTATDDIEKEGVIESERIVREADMVLRLLEPSDWGLDAGNTPFLSKTVVVYTKADLIDDSERLNGKLYTSARTGEGIDTCRSQIAQIVHALYHASKPDTMLLVERHNRHLSKAREHLYLARNSLDRWSEEIASFELKNAEEEISRIIGRIVDSDLLDEVFKNFCIGK